MNSVRIDLMRHVRHLRPGCAGKLGGSDQVGSMEVCLPSILPLGAERISDHQARRLLYRSTQSLRYLEQTKASRNSWQRRGGCLRTAPRVIRPTAVRRCHYETCTM